MKKIIFPFVIIFFLSCKKDRDNTCNLDTASVSGSHKITTVRYKATPSGTETDYYNTFFPDACDRDDIYAFNSNGTYILTDAGVVCSPSNDDTGTWSLTGNTMTIDGGAANVESFNCNTLTLSFADAFNTGDKLTIIFTRQ